MVRARARAAGAGKTRDECSRCACVIRRSARARFSSRSCACSATLGRRSRRAVAERCIVGVDIDPRAVAAARAAVERFVGAPVPALREHLRVGDALARRLAQPVRCGRRESAVHAAGAARRRKHALRAVRGYDGVADLYVYFVELAHRIVRPGGRYCLIVPNKWLTAAYGAAAARVARSASSSVEGVVDFAARALFARCRRVPVHRVGHGRRRGDAPIRAARAARPRVARALAGTGDRARARALARERGTSTRRATRAARSPRAHAGPRSATSCPSGRRAASSPAATARS